MGQLNLRLAEFTWANAPDAVSNDRMVIVITDVNNQAFMSDGVRWKPLSGMIPLKVETLGTTITQASSNVSTPSAVSAFKLTIPRSSVNGSLLKASDILKIRTHWDKSVSSSNGLQRHIRVGHDATVPLNNTQLAPTGAGASAILCLADEAVLHIVSSSSILMPGRSKLNQFDTTDSSSGNSTVTTVPNMDNAVTYIDVCPVWANNTASESAVVRFHSALVEVY